MAAGGPRTSAGASSPRPASAAEQAGSLLPATDLHWELFADTEPAPCGGLWCFPLDVADNERLALASVLSPAERERAGRFHTETLRARFTVAHAKLRMLLAQQVGMPAGQIEFGTGAHGKPYLVGDASSSGVRFNLSHSDAVGFVGLSARREIGVDVELRRTLRDEAALVHRYFSAVEIAAYEALPAERRSAAFFDGWTRKEAYVKAVGRGIALDLASFDVSLEPATQARLLRASATSGDHRRWGLAAPQGPAHIALAVVLEAEAVHVREVPAR